MDKLVTVYDKNTGERVPYKVPAHFVGHPLLGPDWARNKPNTRSIPPADMNPVESQPEILPTENTEGEYNA